MSKLIDFESYRDKAHLELCLSLIEDAYSDIKRGNYDLVELQLQEILETFDIEQEADTEEEIDNGMVLQFPTR